MRTGWRTAREWIVNDTSWSSDLVRAILIYLVTRVALALFVWLVQQHEFCHGPRCIDNKVVPGNRFLNGLFQWDAVHYYRIMVHGYYPSAGMESSAPFFPGFPVVGWIAGRIFGSVLYGGIVVNHVASVVASFIIARLVRALEIGERRDPTALEASPSTVNAVAREASLFWLAAPLTFFFAVFLSESLFALASVATIYAVVRGRWPLALIAGIAASATRNAGLIVCACALVLAFERRKLMPVPRLGWLCLLLMPAGLGAFSVYQHFEFGDGFAWVHAQSAWNRRLVFPWQTLQQDWIGLPGNTPSPVDAMYRTQELLALGLLFPLFFLRKRLGIPWALWLLGVAEWMVPLLSNSLLSSARYQSANLYFALAIPAFLAERPTTRAIAWLLFGMVLAFYATMFPVGNWAS